MACERCGCEGIHACIGHKPAPWTEEEKGQLRKALGQVLAGQEPLGEPFSTVLHENRWELYEGGALPANGALRGSGAEEQPEREVDVSAVRSKA